MPPKYEKKKERVVISSAGADEAFARQLREALKDAYDVWYYKDSMPVEINGWDGVIDEALRSARFVIGVLSKEAVESEHVRREWLWASNQGPQYGVIFLTVQIEAVDPGHQFGSMTWTSFLDRPFETSVRELRNQMRRAMQRRITAVADAVDPGDPYARDLQTLWKRVQATLSHLIIPSLEAEPLELESNAVPEAIMQTPQSREYIDLVLQRYGVFDQFSSIHDAFDFYGRRLLLLGAPGSGKTVTWFFAVREAILARLENPGAPIPVIANIQFWDGTPLIDWLEKYPHSPKETRNLIECGNAILFIDGLDELSDHRVTSGADDPYRLHRAFMEQLPTNCPVLVTCRTEDYEKMHAKIPLNGAVCLRPLGPLQIQQYLKTLPALYEMIQDDPDLMQLVSTPLYLSMFAFACERMTPEERQKFVFGSPNRSQFREKLVVEYIRRCYDHERRRHRTKMLPVTVERLMEALGRVAMRNVSSVLAVPNSISLNELNLMSANTTERDALKQTALTLGLLQPTTPRRYKFIHLMVRDTLAFYYCTRNYKEVGEYTDRYMNPALAIGRLKDERATRFLRFILQDVSNTAARRHVALAFGYHKDPETFNDLIKLLRDNDDYVQAHAIESLSALGDVRAVDHVLAVVNSSLSKAVREAGCRALGALGSDKSIDPLIDLLKDDNTLVVKEAAKALGRLKAQRAAGALRRLLSEKDKNTRAAIVEVLGELHDREAVPQLSSLLENEKSSSLKTTIVDALARIASREAVPSLIRKLNHREDLSSDLRANIAFALGEIGDPAAIPALVEAASLETVEETYNHIADALRKLGHTEIPAYEVYFDDNMTTDSDTENLEPFELPWDVGTLNEDDEQSDKA